MQLLKLGSRAAAVQKPAKFGSRTREKHKTLLTKKPINLLNPYKNCISKQAIGQLLFSEFEEAVRCSDQLLEIRTRLV
jgi:hypothetical protein